MTRQGAGMPRTIATALVRVALVVLTLLLLVFYLRLGYFLAFVFLAGAGLAVAVTRGHWKSMPGPVSGIGAVLLAYIGLTWLAWATLVDQQTERTFSMRWESRGSANDRHTTEVVLHFVDYPGHYVGEFSDDLAAYLASGARNPLPVTFRVTRDLGWCTRGFHLIRVGDRESWRSAWGYAGATGATPSPWRNPWWCP